MKHLVIIDGYSFFFRAYHAVRPLSRSDGLPVNALYGFAQMLLKVVKDMQPDLCAVALDSATNFRKDIYPAYKAHRKEMDDDMVKQLPYFEPLVHAFGIPALKVEGVEADDIIATLVNNHKHDYKITIVSSDKDLMQLLTVDNVCMFDTMKGVKYQKEEVFEKFGVYPDKVIEVQSLIGDSSDNIPGVPSVGPKTAAKLVQEYGNLDTIYANLHTIKQEKLRQTLSDNKAQAYLSKQLVTLRQDVDCQCPEETLRFHPDVSSAHHYLNELELFSLAKRLQSNGNTAKQPQTKAEIEPKPEQTNENKPLQNSESLLTNQVYECVQDAEKLGKWIQKLEGVEFFAVDTETDNLNPLIARLVGISLAVKPGEACYIPLAHQLDMLDHNSAQLNKAEVLKALRPLLESEKVRKIGHNMKYDMHVFAGEGIHIKAIEDTMLMSFCLDAGKHNHNMDDLAALHLNHTCISFKDVCGSGKSQITFDKVPLDKATAYAAEDADVTLRLYHHFVNRLNQPANAGVRHVYETIERPLVPVLAKMEQHGIAVDAGVLRQLSQNFSSQMEVHEQKIFTLAGTTFNVSSPLQLGKVLFDDLGLKVGSGKSRSTNVNVLEKLAEDGHPIANEILYYRQLSKLKSTYTEALISMINPHTNKVHTHYNQAGAATGRFSSSDPNLQNIPVRSENGRKIRAAFVAAPQHVLLGLDYSQIELRLLAHASNSAMLIEAFNQGADIHRFTASQIFSCTPEQVTAEQRNVAKTINFGIVYGMGAQALARQIGVKKDEASAYIEAYFKRYEGVKEFMDAQIAFARSHGYVETMFGRRIHVPEIDASNGGLRAGAERAAINAPLQGANADIIKMVMPKLQQMIDTEKLPVAMLLQVHDELVFEVPEAQVEPLAQRLKSVMEQVVSLKVPLKVGYAYGRTWDQAH